MSFRSLFSNASLVLRFDATRRPPGARAGFSLIELLMVVAIMATLMCMLLPAIDAARESARRSICTNHLKQIGLAIANYRSANNRFPHGQSRPHIDFELIAWSVLILPHLDENAAHSSIRLDCDLRSAENQLATGTIIEVYLCPSTDQGRGYRDGTGRLGDLNEDGDFSPEIGEGMACIDYMGVEGPNREQVNPRTGQPYGQHRGVLIGLKGDFVHLRPKRVDRIVDGERYTIAVAESSSRSAQFLKDADSRWELSGTWASGENTSHIEHPINSQNHHYDHQEEIFSDHPGGANVLYADGLVAFLSDDTPLDVLYALTSRNGKEDLSLLPSTANTGSHE